MPSFTKRREQLRAALETRWKKKREEFPEAPEDDDNGEFDFFQ